jgi:hypothetical protein
MSKPEAKDFLTVGEYAEALVEYLIAKRLNELTERVERIEALVVP